MQVEFDGPVKEDCITNSTFGKINNTDDKTSTTSRRVNRKMKNSNEKYETTMLESIKGSESFPASD